MCSALPVILEIFITECQTVYALSHQPPVRNAWSAMGCDDRQNIGLRLDAAICDSGGSPEAVDQHDDAFVTIAMLVQYPATVW